MKLWCNNLLSKMQHHDHQLETYRKRLFLELPLTSVWFPELSLTSTDQERVQNIIIFEADGSCRLNCITAAKELRSQYENNA